MIFFFFILYDVIQVKYTDEITLVVGNEACDLDSGTYTVADKQTDSKPDILITDRIRNREPDSGCTFWLLHSH